MAIDVLPPSSRRQADVHRTSAFKPVQIPNDDKSTHTPLGCGHQYVIVTRLAAVIEMEGFDFHHHPLWGMVIDVLPPSSRRQADVHRTSAFKSVQIPNDDKNTHTPLGCGHEYAIVTRLAAVIEMEGFDFHHHPLWGMVTDVLPPSSRRQADVHRTSAFRLVQIPYQSQKEDHPLGGLLFGGDGGI